MTIRKTNAQFLMEVYTLYQNEYIPLEEYTKKNIKIKMLHTKCNTEYMVTPDNFLRGRKCPECAGKLMNTEKFKAKVYDMYKDEYLVLSEYKGALEYITVKHIKCGEIYDTLVSNFLRGRKCAYCVGRKKLDNKYFDKRLKKLFGDEYIRLGNYIDSSTKIKIKHNIEACGYEYEVISNNILRKRGCPKCAGKRRTTETFKLEIKEILGEDYEVLNEYKNNISKVKVLHIKCNKTYLASPANMLNGARCHHCFGGLVKTQKQFEEEIKEIYDDEYKIVGTYQNAKTKIEIFHKKCRNIIETTPDSLLHGHGCPKCGKHMSKGEKRISKYLNKYGYFYIPQYAFKDCRNINSLPFDFAILNETKKILFLCEYDGPQHFYAVDYFGGEKGFKDTQRNDQIKNDYCIQNNIPLLRISYLEFNDIESILEKELEKYVLVPV